MLLSDRDLHLLISDMSFETDEPKRPFDPDVQVQPCSIDLRLDRCFWLARKPTRWRSIDLRSTGAGEIDIRRLFRTHWAGEAEGITIRPGEMLLGRTFEKFRIPNGYAGKLEGRSTYARLGLSIHCTGDFINPGWRGRMPLQLVNHGAVPIIVTPYMQISQLLVVRTTTPSDAPYGSANAGHKYVDDEGGPSKYWLDDSLRKLQESLQHGKVSEDMQRRFLDGVGRTDVESMDRFSDFVSSLRPKEITSAREVMERFADKDTRRHTWARRRLLFYRWFGFLLVTPSVGALFKQPFGWLHVCFWSVTFVLVILGFWAHFFAKEPSQPFTRGMLDERFPPSR